MGWRTRASELRSGSHFLNVGTVVKFRVTLAQNLRIRVTKARPVVASFRSGESSFLRASLCLSLWYSADTFQLKLAFGKRRQRATARIINRFNCTILFRRTCSRSELSNDATSQHSFQHFDSEPGCNERVRNETTRSRSARAMSNEGNS